eukprot:1619294-Pyramimonas_sp.AAC.1
MRGGAALTYCFEHHLDTHEQTRAHTRCALTASSMLLPISTRSPPRIVGALFGRTQTRTAKVTLRRQSTHPAMLTSLVCNRSSARTAGGSNGQTCGRSMRRPPDSATRARALRTAGRPRAATGPAAGYVPIEGLRLVRRRGIFLLRGGYDWSGRLMFRTRYGRTSAPPVAPAECAGAQKG